jgi:hypothetical protein
MSGLYLIRKNGMYYRPNAQGYTSSVAEAGRYTLEEAIRHSHPNGPDGPRDGISYEPAYAGSMLSGCMDFSEQSPQPPHEAQREDRPERCARCGHPNTVWRAPSPLWNAVVRGGCINGEPIFDDMLCAACFMVLAEEKGIAANFRVIADDIFAELQTTTPSGRVWNEEDWLWRPSPNGRGDGLKIQHSPGSNPGDATSSTLPAAASVEAGEIIEMCAKVAERHVNPRGEWIIPRTIASEIRALTAKGKDQADG